MDPLATLQDLTNRNITVPDAVSSDAVLASVSESIRDAAGCPITQATSTITLVVTDDAYRVDLPAGPVSSVASVMVDGTANTDWSKIGDSLYFNRAWTSCLPAEITVTYTHGLPTVPADIVDLACGMAAMSFAQAGDTYGSKYRTTSIRLGDYGESFNVPAGSEAPSPVALPDTVRDRLRARFGMSANVVKVH